MTAIWAAAIAEILFVWLAQTVSVGGTKIYTIVVNATLIFLFLSFTIPIALGYFAIGTAKWPKMGPWKMGVGVYKLFAVLSVLGMILIVFIAVQPPNGKVLWITLAFLVACGHGLVRVRESPLQGTAGRRRDHEASGRDRGNRGQVRRSLTG